MLHPDTELGYVNPIIGHGVFASRPLPRGTIVWVRDDLDQTLSPFQVARIASRNLRELVEHYAFVDRRGDYVLCWDHGRYLNHGCEPSCIGTGYDFGIAVRDIAAGEELTNDYGLLGRDRSFLCRCGSVRCRRAIRSDDVVAYGDRWRALTAQALRRLPYVAQPLWELVRDKDDVARSLGGKVPAASSALLQSKSAPPPSGASGFHTRVRKRCL